MELFQAEWCPYSHQVRQRLTELGLDFVARQVAADPDDRDEMEHETGLRSIPTLVTDEGDPIEGADDILAWLEQFPDRDDAGAHRAKSRAEVKLFTP